MTFADITALQLRVQELQCLSTNGNRWTAVTFLVYKFAQRDIGKLEKKLEFKEQKE